MFGTAVPVIGLLIYLVFLAAMLYGGYWVVRLGVRHGVEDAWRHRNQ